MHPMVQAQIIMLSLIPSPSFFALREEAPLYSPPLLEVLVADSAQHCLKTVYIHVKADAIIYHHYF